MAVQGRRLIAVDGRTVRGARGGDQAAPHLLAALGRATGTVLTQRKVADRSNEIPALPEPVEPLDLDGAVVTADAMHTQAATADWTDFPAAAQVLQVRLTRTTTRRTRAGATRRKRTSEVVHLIRSPPAGQARPRAVADLGPGALGHREPPPPDPRRHPRRGPPPAAHRRRPTSHGHPEERRHQPHTPGPRPHQPHRHHQIPGKSPPDKSSHYSPNHPPKPALQTPGLPLPVPPSWMSVTMTLTAPSGRGGEVSVGILRIVWRGAAPSGSNVILTDTDGST